ncbi:siderophore-interacting protein [Corynebacterium urinipleomorphum]|uniref:siderophore-interacting protein n=1 Tax=Corynebacterium urinipleomorphum TaxID=1852380 RepID=UPI0011780A38|nr:siderophore-interacting protein [Corynebacterium urinipleomorphum]
MANFEIAPHVREITFHAEELSRFGVTGPDEFFGLLMPQHGQEYVPIPPQSTANIRGHVASLPNHSRPDLRWYTIRHLNWQRNTLSTQITTHGVKTAAEATGPGLRWVLSAEPGDKVGIVAASGLWHRPSYAPFERAVPQLLIGDATSAPSILSILEFLDQFHSAELSQTHVVLVASSSDDHPPEILSWRGRVASMELLYARYSDHVSVLQRCLTHKQRNEQAFDDVRYVYACCESALAKQARSFAKHELGIDPKNIFWSPFWIQGRPRP